MYNSSAICLLFLQSRTVEASRNSRSMENLDYEPGRKSSKNPEKQSRKRDSKDEEQQRKNKKENRKSTPSAMPSSGGISSSHGSPSRAAEKSSGSSSGNQKRRDPQPSGVGAVGGRGSILHNTVNPLLTEVCITSCCVVLAVLCTLTDILAQPAE